MKNILKIQNTEDTYIISKPDDISWNSPKIQEELEKENIIFNGCLFAIKIINRKMNNPKYQSQYENSFDASWINDLFSVIRKAQEKAIGK